MGACKDSLRFATFTGVNSDPQRGPRVTGVPRERGGSLGAPGRRVSSRTVKNSAGVPAACARAVCLCEPSLHFCARSCVGHGVRASAAMLLLLGGHVAYHVVGHVSSTWPATWQVWVRATASVGTGFTGRTGRCDTWLHHPSTWPRSRPPPSYQRHTPP